MKLQEKIQQYIPFNEQEETDKAVILNWMKTADNMLTRKSQIAHFTASAWVINEEKNKVLMIYHNIYQSWSWPGGHADGEEDLIKVAIREVREETGVEEVIPIFDDIFSLEILTVDGHLKNGSYVSSHLHVNVTFLLQAKEGQILKMKPDENSGVKWFEMNQAPEASCEPWMQVIYRKLNQKIV